jgi:ADP-ribose pyrophosphatase
MKKKIPFGVLLVPENARKAFSGELFDVYQWDQEMYDGSSAIFEMLKRPDSCCVIGVVEDKIVLLTDEQPHRAALQTLPGGRCEEGDASPLEAAQREMLEETGYTFTDWKLLAVDKPTEKIEWFNYIYLATNPTSLKKTKHGIGERISVSLKTLTDVQVLVSSKEHARLRGPVGDMFTEARTISEFLLMPEFEGVEVDR